MKSRLIIFCSIFFVSATKLCAQGPTPEDICNATVMFINTMGTDNFQSYMTTEVVEKIPELKYNSYKSSTQYPSSIKTVIVDTNSVKKYRTAKVLYSNITTQTQDLNPDLLNLYNNFNLVFQACLGPNKFTWTSDEEAPFHIYDKETTYSFQLPSDDEGLFSLSNSLQVKVYIDVFKTDTGLFMQELNITFTII